MAIWDMPELKKKLKVGSFPQYKAPPMPNAGLNIHNTPLSLPKRHPSPYLLPPQPLFRTPSNVISNFGLKARGGQKDWDFDGVPNGKDCQPRNTMRQDRVANQRILIEKSKQVFGTTKNPLEAGYILPTGEMLDLSGRHQVSGRFKEDMANQRSVDHRELYEVFEGTKIKSKYDESDDASSYIRQFQRKANAIRVSPQKESFGFEVLENQKITPAQKRVLIKSGIGKDIYYDVAWEKDNVRLPEHSNKNIRGAISLIEKYQKDKEDYEQEKSAEAFRQTIEPNEIVPQNPTGQLRRLFKKEIEKTDRDREIAEKKERDRIADIEVDKELELFREEYRQEKAKKLAGAPIPKQQEWANKSEPEHITERVTEPDADADGTPNEYDCQPTNPEKQDSQIYLKPPLNSKLVRDKTPKYTEHYYKTMEKSPKEIKKEVAEGYSKQGIMYTYPRDTTSIYIGNRLRNVDFEKPENQEYLYDVLSHEEIHKELNKIGLENAKTGADLDAVSIPTFLNSEKGKIHNPRSAGKISLAGTKKAMEIMYKQPEEQKKEIYDIEEGYGVENAEDIETEQSNVLPDEPDFSEKEKRTMEIEAQLNEYRNQLADFSPNGLGEFGREAIKKKMYDLELEKQKNQ